MKRAMVSLAVVATMVVGASAAVGWLPVIGNDQQGYWDADGCYWDCLTALHIICWKDDPDCPCAGIDGYYPGVGGAECGYYQNPPPPFGDPPPDNPPDGGDDPNPGQEQPEG